MSAVQYRNYTILQSDNPAKLAIQVNDYLKKGWITQGSVAVAQTSLYTTHYVQAVVQPV